MTTTIKVNDMHCPKCVERISKAIDIAGFKAEVDLETKTVTVEDCYYARTVEILDDLGFDPEA